MKSLDAQVEKFEGRPFANTIAGGLKTHMCMLVGLYVDIFTHLYILFYVYKYVYTYIHSFIIYLDIHMFMCVCIYFFNVHPKNMGEM